MQAIDKAIEIVGSQADLARALGIKPQQLHQWRMPPTEKGYRKIPLDHAKAIEVATQGAVTVAQLRPDLAKMFAA